MSAFTPGSWRVGRTPNDIAHVIFGGPDDAMGLRIAEMVYHHRGRGYTITPKEVRANARLIAAAPDLYAALQGALKALDAIGDEMTVGERYTNSGQYLLDALQPARAALAKAEGES